MAWTPAGYCDAVAAEIDRMVALCAPLDPTAPVPSCPDWQCRELVIHLGGVHRWVTAMVQVVSPVAIRRKDLDLGVPDDDRDLPGWLEAGGGPLLSTLRSADPDAPMWAWGVDQHVRFWPRRMLHETCIHRVDAELAAGTEPEVDPEVARDGLEELFVNLPPAEVFSPAIANLRGDGQTLAVEATDLGTGWLITLRPDGFTWERSAGAATATAAISGPMSDLYLVMYRRLPADHRTVTRSGDPSVSNLWLDNAQL